MSSQLVLVAKQALERLTVEAELVGSLAHEVP